jgi:hypothetical protein
MLAMDDSGPPTPDGGTNTSGGDGGTNFAGANFTTNDLWLEIDGVTNQTAALVIHPPWNVTNGVYDLFYTTDLAPPASWQWVMRTAPGQTNLAPTNATDTQGFYKIGGVNSSAGTDFWVAFPAASPGFSYKLTLYVASQVTNTGMVIIPSLNFTNSFTLLSGGLTNIAIPQGALISSYGSVSTNGVHITASQPVCVYGYYYAQVSSEAFTGLPTRMLGTNYCVMSRPSDVPASGYFSQFAVLGTASNTTVTIAPSATANLAGHSGTNSFALTLQPGQTYQINSASYTNDVTGTMVTSDEPIAVFAGADDAWVPDTNTCCGNPLVQEQVPVAAWGNQTLALSWSSFPFGYAFGNLPAGQIYRVLAVWSNTVVTINGVVATTLQPGQFYETNLNGSVEFDASYPIQVAEFNQGAYANEPIDNEIGDPCELLLPSASQYLTSYTIAAPSEDNITGDFNIGDFLNLIVAQSGISTTLVDGAAVAATNFIEIGGSGYYGAQLSVTAGTHTVSSSQPIEVQVFGFGITDIMSYIGGVTVYQ